MPIPVIAYVGAAALGAYLLLRKKTTPASAMSVDAFAEAHNAEADRVNAEIAKLKAQGITPAGAGPRKVDASLLLRGRNGVMFATKGGTLGTVSSDVLGNRLEPGDVITVDVSAGGIHVAEIPEGNMLFMVKSSVPMGGGSVSASSVDPRLPETTNVVNLPQSAITDVLAGGASPEDLATIILGQ